MAALIFFLSLLLSGCTVYQTRGISITPEQQADFRIKQLPKSTDPANGRVAIVVNTDPGTVRLGLIFSGYRSERSLIQFGSDGSPELVEDPIGFFQIDPAYGRDYPRCQEIGPLVPGNTYSVLVMTNTVISGRTLDMQMVVFTMPDRPYQYRYRGRDVNMVVELPYVCYPNNNNDLHLDVNASWAVHKALHRLMYGN